LYINYNNRINLFQEKIHYNLEQEVLLEVLLEVGFDNELELDFNFYVN